MEKTIEQFLTRETLTFGDKKKIDVERVDIDWEQNPPVVRVIVRVADPELPTFKQVSAVQEEINKRQGLRFRLVVQRTAVDIVGPKEKPNIQSSNLQTTHRFKLPSHLMTQNPLMALETFKEVPTIDNIPFLDNMQPLMNENKNNPNSTSELEEIKAPEVPLDIQTTVKPLN